MSTRLLIFRPVAVRSIFSYMQLASIVAMAAACGGVVREEPPGPGTSPTGSVSPDDPVTPTPTRPTPPAPPTVPPTEPMPPPSAPVIAGSPCSEEGPKIIFSGAAANVELSQVSLFPTSSCTSKIVSVIVEKGAVIYSSVERKPSLLIGEFFGAEVRIIVRGAIIGVGGRGGDGGNGGSGRRPRYCGRAGQEGGDAISTMARRTTVIVEGGLVAGGGGGGGGASGGNRALGGGGGAGRSPAIGGLGSGAKSSDEEMAFCGQDNGVRSGIPGASGTERKGGAPGLSTDSYCRAGAGGNLGEDGQASDCFGAATGGAAGYAVRGGGNFVVLQGATKENVLGKY
jgi:hypothetical protein